METQNIPKEELRDEHWEEVGSDAEQEEKEQVDKVVEKKVEKKQLLKDKHGEIIINKLDAYVEPTKAVKEAR